MCHVQTEEKGININIIKIIRRRIFYKYSMVILKITSNCMTVINFFPKNSLPLELIWFEKLIVSYA